MDALLDLVRDLGRLDLVELAGRHRQFLSGAVVGPVVTFAAQRCAAWGWDVVSRRLGERGRPINALRGRYVVRARRQAWAYLGTAVRGGRVGGRVAAVRYPRERRVRTALAAVAAALPPADRLAFARAWAAAEAAGTNVPAALAGADAEVACPPIPDAADDDLAGIRAAAAALTGRAAALAPHLDRVAPAVARAAADVYALRAEDCDRLRRADAKVLAAAVLGRTATADTRIEQNLKDATARLREDVRTAMDQLCRDSAHAHARFEAVTGTAADRLVGLVARVEKATEADGRLAAEVAATRRTVTRAVVAVGAVLLAAQAVFHAVVTTTP